MPLRRQPPFLLIAPAALGAVLAACSSGGLSGLNDSRVATKWSNNGATNTDPEPTGDEPKPHEDPGPGPGPEPDPGPVDEPAAPRRAVILGPQALLAPQGGTALGTRAAILPAAAKDAAGMRTFALNVVFVPNYEEMMP